MVSLVMYHPYHKIAEIPYETSGFVARNLE